MRQSVALKSIDNSLNFSSDLTTEAFSAEASLLQCSIVLNACNYPVNGQLCFVVFVTLVLLPTKIWNTRQFITGLISGPRLWRLGFSNAFCSSKTLLRKEGGRVL